MPHSHWNGLFAAIEFEDGLYLFGMCLKIYVLVGNALIAQKSFAATTVGAPGGTLKNDL